MKLGVAETLAQAEGIKESKKRAEFLASQDSAVLRDVIRLCYDKNLKWALPEGPPPYNENQLPDQHANLYAQWRKMYMFFPDYKIPALRREALFIQFLESLDAGDAKVMVAAKDKKMPYKIPKADFEKAFPGIFAAFKERDKA